MLDMKIKVPNNNALLGVLFLLGICGAPAGGFLFGGSTLSPDDPDWHARVNVSKTVPGKMSPKESRAYFETGEEFSVNCTLTNYSGSGTSSQMYYLHSGNLSIPESWLSAVSDTTLMVTVPAENATSEASGQFICMLRENGIENTWITQLEVNVIDRPPEINELSCVSSDMASMTCSFCAAQEQAVDNATRAFSVKFTWAIRHYPDSNDFGICNEDCLVAYGGSSNTCLFIPDETYELNVTTRNSLDRPTNKAFIIQTNSSIVKADPVSGLVTHMGRRSTRVTWNYPEKLSDWTSFLKLEFYVIVTRDTDKETRMEVVRSSNDSIHVHVPGLLPNTQYTVCVTSKPYSGDYMSEVSCTRATTLMDAPDTGPVVPPGLIRRICEDDTTRCRLHIYWEPSSKDKQNGDIGSYNISYHLTPDSQPVKIVNVPGNSFHYSDDDYMDDIKMVGIQAITGDDETDSTRISPSSIINMHDLLPQMIWPELDKLITEREGDKVTVEWSVKRRETVRGYTIFYCPGVKDNLKILDCKGVPKHVDIPSNQSTWTSPPVTPDVVFAFQIRHKNGPSSGLLPRTSWNCIYDDAKDQAPPIPELKLESRENDILMSLTAMDCNERQGKQLPKIRIDRYLLKILDETTGDIVRNFTLDGGIYQHRASNLQTDRSYAVQATAVSSSGHFSDITRETINLPADKSMTYLIVGIVSPLVIVGIIIAIVCAWKKGVCSKGTVPEPPERPFEGQSLEEEIKDKDYYEADPSEIRIEGTKTRHISEQSHRSGSSGYGTEPPTPPTNTDKNGKQLALESVSESSTTTGSMSDGSTSSVGDTTVDGSSGSNKSTERETSEESATSQERCRLESMMCDSAVVWYKNQDDSSACPEHPGSDITGHASSRAEDSSDGYAAAGAGQYQHEELQRPPEGAPLSPFSYSGSTSDPRDPDTSDVSLPSRTCGGGGVDSSSSFIEPSIEAAPDNKPQRNLPRIIDASPVSESPPPPQQQQTLPPPSVLPRVDGARQDHDSERILPVCSPGVDDSLGGWGSDGGDDCEDDSYV